MAQSADNSTSCSCAPDTTCSSLSNEGFSVEAHKPSVVRLKGFRELFSRVGHDSAECIFGHKRPLPVSCRCDVEQGVMECDVPDLQEVDGGGNVVVRGVVAGVEAPSLSFRYGKHMADNDFVVGEVTVRARAPKWQRNFLRLLRREPWGGRGRTWRLIDRCVAEMLGTMFIVIFGVGSVCSAVLTEYNAGLWQVAVVWGFGVSLAIHATGSISGAHLNPAVSLAFALVRPDDFPWPNLLPYWISQYLGGVLGGAFNLMIYGRQFRHFEKVKNIVRGTLSSVTTASAFGEYFPNPGFEERIAMDVVSPLDAMLVEAWGTGILMFIILAVTDSRHKIIKTTAMIPFYIGFTVAVLISLYAPLTQAGWNPARDFGPRIVAALAGWGRIAIPGPRNGFWVYIVGPKIGAAVGALLYDALLYPALGPLPSEERKE